MDLLKPVGMRKGGHNEIPTRPRPKTPPPSQSDITDLKSIRKVNLKKDDIIVLTVDKSLSNDEIVKIKELAGTVFPDNKVTILSGGMKLSVIRKKE